MWLQQRFPQGQDQHREGSDLLLLLGFGVSQSEPLLFVHGPAAGAERGTPHCRAGVLSPSPPSGTSPAQIPAPGASRERVPAPGEPHSPAQCSPSHSRDKSLALPVTTPSPGQDEAGKGFFPQKNHFRTQSW